MKKRVIFLIGTRPEAIKTAPVLLAFRESECIESFILLSGQHPQLPEAVLASFGLRADKVLFPKRDGEGLTSFWATLLPLLEGALSELSPYALFVHGDTATAAVGALAAFHKHIPVVHIEAGLRTGCLDEPFPEELYRLLIDRIATLCFAPTERAKEQLLREGKEPKRIFVTGNTAIDALRYTVRGDFTHPLLEAVGNRQLILATMHRREGRGEPFRAVCRAIRRAAEEDASLFFLFVTHPDPHLKEEAERLLSGCKRILLSPPLAHTVFQNLLAHAFLLLTDSGGLEEEACALGIKTLVLREKTEREEGFGGGCLIPVGREEERLYRAIMRLSRLPRSRTPDPCFGDGHAAERIYTITKSFFFS